MKYSLIALAATTVCGASAAANNLQRRHNHAAMVKRHQADPKLYPTDPNQADCGCTTYLTTRVVPVTSELSPPLRLGGACWFADQRP